MVVGKGGKVADDSLLVRFSNTLELERQDILSSKSKNILGHAARNVGYESIEITSTIRYPKQQAEAMYTNLENKKRLQYAAPGMAVTAVYDDGKQNGFDKTTIIQKMENKIIALSKEGKRVSKHCVGLEIYKKTNIVDINIPTTKVKEFIMELAKNNSVEKIFHDILDIKDEGKISRLAKEPCIHVEIKQ